MGIPGSANLLMLGGEAQAYQIDQSLRFNSADSAYLNRTPGSSGSTTTWTISCWVKRAALGSAQMIWSAGTSNVTYLTFNADDTLKLRNGSGNADLVTTQKFRDPSAWYHIVVRWDTTNGTSADRVIFYINGTELVPGDFGTHDDAGASEASNWNTAVVHNFGRYAFNSTSYLNGYLAEVNFIDDATLDADDFGESDANGVWRPIEYAGSYTGNSFYLKFASGDGTDSSGLSNTWTANSFTTSAPGTDVLSDTPTTNWCTWNPLDNLYSSHTLSEGNLRATTPIGANYAPVKSTFGMSTGKWYWECVDSSGTGSSAAQFGIVQTVNTNDYLAAQALSVAYSGINGQVARNTSLVTTAATFNQGDVIAFAFDADALTLAIYKNNTLQTTVTGITAGVWFAAGSDNTSIGGGYKLDANFGQREFAYPAGTASATDYFNTVTYTGNGSNGHAITGVGFQPDLVWGKCRNVGTDHYWVDAVRGVTTVLRSNTTNAEYTQTDSLVSFNSDGFTLDDDNSGGPAGNFNISGRTYVAWCWKAGGSGSANNTGTINATVSANQDAGFSVVTYSGGGSAGTVAHGLSSAPKVYFVKNRSSATAYNWYVYTEATGAGHFLKLNTNSAKTASNDPFNNTAPTSSVFSVGGENVVNGVDYVAYCFADVTGVAKHGSYSGTGSTQFIECGFKPAMVIMKSSANAREWIMKDTARGDDKTLEPHETNTEAQSETVGYQSNPNGFTLVGNSVVNTSGDTLIFMAFAENFAADEDFKSLNTANLPAPDIADGSEYFNTVLYTGTGATLNVTGLGFSPDLVWTKNRSSVNNNRLYDVLRGTTKELYSNTTDAETTDANSLTAFNSDGFTLGSSSGPNNNGSSYVAWAWDAGGSGSSNTAGTITSTVSANPTAGFSIVTYTGTNADDATVGHGLGVKPAFIIVKNRGYKIIGWLNIRLWRRIKILYCN
jgi:hypothetical protein